MDVVIHGHFYQPPRENPWSGEVPRQESAAPAHDWNERITDECYKPNARSRVLGEANLIEEIVNNYAFVSYDFGPTLLTWLESRAPEIYRQIIEGDHLSVSLQEGHGNAIAHVYNHMIMPLANYRDKRTQIVWGLRDFEWRFGRKSESIWLAETAVNLETVKLLIEFGIRYIILSPHQALRTRPLDRSRGWTDVGAGRIDPRRPYRFFLKDTRKRRIRDRYLDVFFYDGPLAADISFAHLLRSGPGLAERLQEAGAALEPGSGLVNVATDGEVYGHHEPFADMCLSYVIRREGPRRGMRFTNYGRYLDLHPPQHEVNLNFGDHDEGTAWSCAHGVGRWERDCGCSTGTHPEWTQRWRTPLRRGLDMVRDRMIETYLEQCSPLLRDPWAARDDYILVMLDHSSSARDALLQQHARRKLTPVEQKRVWCLLESQRYAMYMYTSCAWFFEDISGIETVQNMAYACRAMELAQPWQSLDLEDLFLEYAAEAASNVPGMGSGADIYRDWVMPQRIRPHMVAGGVAIGAAVLGESPAETQFRYSVRALRFDRSPQGAGGEDEAASYHGALELTDRDTGERHLCEVHVYGASSAKVRCYVLPMDGDGSDAPERFPWIPPESDVREAPGVQLLGLKDLVAQNREQVVRTAYESILREQDHLLTKLFEEGRELMTTCRQVGVPAPAVLRAAAEHVISRMLADKAGQLRERILERFGPAGTGGPAPTEELQNGLLAEIAELLNFVRENELVVSLAPLAGACGEVIGSLLERLLKEPEARVAAQCVAVMRTSFQLQFPLDRRPLEDLAFQVLGKHRSALKEIAASSSDDEQRRWHAFEELAGMLRLNIHWILEQTGGL